MSPTEALTTSNAILLSTESVAEFPKAGNPMTMNGYLQDQQVQRGSSLLSSYHKSCDIANIGSGIHFGAG
jgi:hypothetical protein